MHAVGQLITRRVAQRVLGRDRELAVLAETLDENGPFVLFLHGLGGIGKTTLLEAFVEVARSKDATVAAVDCGGVEPTEDCWLSWLASWVPRPISRD